MKLKILVFDQEPSLRELLRTYLAGQGHEVLAFRDPTGCPLFSRLLDERCCCPRERACADVILADIDLQSINALDFLKLQRRRGCKALDANKAVMSASMSRALRSAVEELGCQHFKKPFHLTDISKWIDDCAARVLALKGRSG